MAKASLGEGDIAPNFTLMNQDGKPVKLSKFKGKYVVLYFYPKDNTPGCTTQGCQFRDYNEEIQKNGGVVLGISADSQTSHQKFRSSHEFQFDLLSDTEKQVAKKYEAWRKKKLFGREYYGMQRCTFLIDPKGIILKKWDKANPKTNAKEALEAIVEINKKKN